EQRVMLTESQFNRLHLNRWTEAEDRLTTHADLAACTTLDGPLEPVSGAQYAVGLDIGLTNDRTVLTVCQGEIVGERTRVLVARQGVWQGRRAHPVDLDAVEAWAWEVHQRYSAPTFV